MLRQSHDINVVVIDAERFVELAEALRGSCLIADPMERRQRVEVPGLGQVWVASVEDLVLAKLVWSEGTSELQLRDCAQLIRFNATTLDRAYLERWAERLGVSGFLSAVEA